MAFGIQESNFAINLGATNLVVVDLNPNPTHKEYLNKPYVKYIHPTRSLGSFMLFDRHIIDANMKLGYLDTLKSYGKYDGFRFCFKKTENQPKGVREYILDIANTIAKTRRQGQKTIIKPESDGDIYAILEKYTERPLTDYDYFLRSLEIIAEMYNLDYLHVYEVNEMARIIFDYILQTELVDDILDGYNVLKPNKQKEMLLKINDQALLRYLVNKILGNSYPDEELIVNLSLAKPYVFIGYSLINAMFNFLGDYI